MGINIRTPPHQHALSPLLEPEQRCRERGILRSFKREVLREGGEGEDCGCGVEEEGEGGGGVGGVFGGGGGDIEMVYQEH